MLSSDILTEFRGRSDEIRVHPLSFAEYYSAVGGDKNEAFDEYAFYGGMPLILSRPDDTAKMNYLKSLFSEVYIKDIVERKRMENIIYNELTVRQFSVDVGIVYSRTVNDNGSSVRTPRKIDFVVNSGGKRTYIQSAYAMPTDEKAEAELRPFMLTRDSFPKIVVRKDIGKRWYDDNGILNINVIDFLLDKELV